jgi:hypothetical protein
MSLKPFVDMRRFVSLSDSAVASGTAILQRVRKIWMNH